jgi:hypothetical protein
MLKVIQRYFTCEGRFKMIYQYHIRLLLHFTGKDTMNLPFYLFRSIDKMSDTVQAKSKEVDTSVFHSSVIKMMVMDELRNKNMNWEEFITSSHFHLNISPTPQSKMQSPLHIEKTVNLEVNKKQKRNKTARDDKETKDHE